MGLNRTIQGDVELPLRSRPMVHPVGTAARALSNSTSVHSGRALALRGALAHADKRARHAANEVLASAKRMDRTEAYLIRREERDFFCFFEPRTTFHSIGFL